MKLVLIGGCVTLTIPRAMLRELGWTQHTYVYLVRGNDQSLVVHHMELPEHDPSIARKNPARAYRPSGAA